MTNIVEILKNAPQGLELYSPVYGKINLRKYTHNVFPIVCTDIEDTDRFFTSSGKFRDDFDSECILFPSKKHKSWNNWQEILFQKGDVITVSGGEILLFNCTDYAFTNKAESRVITKGIYRYATPEEREQFMVELNANGYKWNVDTKQIEKIEQQYTPKYKVGDWIISTDTNTDNEYFYESDKIEPHKITSIKYNKYEIDEYIIEDTKEFDTIATIRLATEQELIDAGIKEKQFTVDDFKPFDKVLVQDMSSHWTCDFYIRYDNTHKLYACITSTWDTCIPYNDETKHLLGTTDDCPKKYKTW